MSYTAKDYSKLLGMEGLSDSLLKNHFTLYQGYVTNTGKLIDVLDRTIKEGKTGTSVKINMPASCSTSGLMNMIQVIPQDVCRSSF